MVVLDVTSEQMARERSLWDEVAAVAVEPVLWRRHSDHVNATLLERWLGEDRFGSVLKTDLFDEHLSGGLYPQLRRRALRMAAADLSPRVVREVTARLPDIDARVADVRQLPFDDGEFDLIVSNSTLDHFPARADIGRALTELGRVLSADGRLVITLDNLANPVVALRAALPRAPLRRLGLVAYPVGVTLGPRGLRRMLERSGYELLESTAIMHVPRLPAVALARHLDGRAAASDRFLSAARRVERVEGLPIRYFTGYFAAALARKRR